MHIIFCGDVRDQNNWPVTESIRSFITSIPYRKSVNYGTDLSGHKIEDTLLSDWESKIDTMFVRSWICAEDMAMFFLQVKADYIGARALEIAKKNGWYLRNTFAWVFSATVPCDDNGNEFSFGQFNAITSDKFTHNGFELVYQLIKRRQGKGGVFVPGEEPTIDRLAIGTSYKDKTNLKRFNAANPGQEKPDLRCRGNVWAIPYSTKNKTQHPCPFPADLAERCLMLQGIAGTNGIVMDPFAGEGSVGVAAMRLGLGFWGIDLNPQYCEWAEKNINDEAQTIEFYKSRLSLQNSGGDKI